MSTGPVWDITNPRRPVADFDVDAVRDLFFDWSLWLADANTTYLGHSVMTDGVFEVVSSAGDATTGVVVSRVKVADPEQVVMNKQYPVTCQLQAADGQVDEQTLWLRIVQK
jgi:hypothetical protein